LRALLENLQNRLVGISASPLQQQVRTSYKEFPNCVE
jgi:hypothetical protein